MIMLSFAAYGLPAPKAIYMIYPAVNSTLYLKTVIRIKKQKNEKECERLSEYYVQMIENDYQVSTR